MFDLLSELRASEISSVITGVCGLVFGGAQYKRARTAESRATSAEERAVSAEARARDAERKQLELAAASEKDQALVEAHTVRAALDLLHWKVSTLKADAYARGDSVSQDACDEEAQSLVNLFEPYKDIEAELKTVSPETATHETIKAIKEYRTMLRRGIADKDLNEKRVDDCLLEIRRGMDLRCPLPPRVGV